MKQYPSIPYGGACDNRVVVFDKLDGSNVRAEWSKKQGWHKFGSRSKLIDGGSGVLQAAPALIVERYGEDLSRAFTDACHERVVAFFEFYGPQSFAGQHDGRDAHEVTLLDVSIHKQGLMEAEDFVESFGRLGIPNVIHIGAVSAQMIQDVRDGTLPGMTFEGVVCKGRRQRKTGENLMFKQKNGAWVERLRAMYGHDVKKFESLL